MQTCIFDRETGRLSPHAYTRSLTAQLLTSFGLSGHQHFQGRTGGPAGWTVAVSDPTSDPIAHENGVSAIATDKFGGRLLISGGHDGSLRLWDLDSQRQGPHAPRTHFPLATVPRSVPGSTGGAARGHGNLVSHLDFYPFDADAFLSSSFDRSLKLWSTKRAVPAATFDLGSTVFAHSTSPIAQHVLVACATQHPSVRLVDLKSGAAVQALVACSGPVLATAWSPRREHILVSGHADGSARVWDVRRTTAVVGLLDMEDSLGIVHRFEHAVASGQAGGQHLQARATAKAHTDAVNGLAWTDDGLYLVSAGLDRQLRIWDAATGANTLVNFGPAIQNQHLRHQIIIVAPAGLTTESCRDVLFWPNDREILALDMHQGRVVSRLRAPAFSAGAGSSSSRSARVTDIAWRGAGGYGRQTGPAMGGGDPPGGLYSAHADGRIRSWIPRLRGHGNDGSRSDDDEDDVSDEEEQRRSKKKRALDDAFRSLMGRQITYA